MADDGLLSWLGNALGGLGSANVGGMPPDPPTPGMPPVQGLETNSATPPPANNWNEPPPVPGPFSQPPAPPPMPPQVPPGMDAAASPPTSDPTLSPPTPPPYPAGGDPMTAGGPTPNGPGLPPAPPPVPGNPPPPPPAPGPTPPPPPAPGGPVSLAPPPPPPGPPTSLAPPPAAAPYKLGDQTSLGRALGIDPKSTAFNQLVSGAGGALTAAGNSKGKSPFQALTSGGGAALEAGEKTRHADVKDAQGYLTQAIASKKAGDDAAYKTNYNQYLLAKLKSEQDKTASKDAANKNDSPTQLFLAAQRNVAADPLVKGAMTAYQSALKGATSPTAPEVVAAKAAYEQTVQERQAAHLAGVGLHPQTAAEVAKQPGMTQANPLDAGAAGITKENIGQKLQPGQYYKNPADGKVYQFKGAPSKDTAKSATPAVTKPEPANPIKSDKTRVSAAADDDEED